MQTVDGKWQKKKKEKRKGGNVSGNYTLEALLKVLYFIQ